jgi:hypothetical protein
VYARTEGSEEGLKARPDQPHSTMGDGGGREMDWSGDNTSSDPWKRNNNHHQQADGPMVRPVCSVQ